MLAEKKNFVYSFDVARLWLEALVDEIRVEVEGRGARTVSLQNS